MFAKRCIRCLASFPALVSARFGVAPDSENTEAEEDDDVQTQEYLVLPHLRSLTLEICKGYWQAVVDPTATSIIHGVFALPSLEHLAYVSVGTMIHDPGSGSESPFVTSLSRMLERSKPLLTSFHSEGIPIKDVDLVSLLK
ncbi:hypothetical protein VNI00_007286 [Paramarasmius palmivorus]|uniref:Uncharacterized protein n=1 Tax=Paramarasmius palmivorus TaxID=297713 RepID=A0AAW0D574_9AGAR